MHGDVCCGGGGLLAGIAAFIKRVRYFESASIKKVMLLY
jgi:threonine dehydratase